jgi:hypothetical protein
MITHRNLGSHLNIWYRHRPALDQCRILSDISNVFHGRFLMTNLTFVLMQHSVKCYGRSKVLLKQFSNKWKVREKRHRKCPHTTSGKSFSFAGIPAPSVLSAALQVACWADCGSSRGWPNPVDIMGWTTIQCTLARSLQSSAVPDQALPSSATNHRTPLTGNNRSKMLLQPLHELASCNNILYNGTEGVTSNPDIPLHIFIAFF